MMKSKKGNNRFGMRSRTLRWDNKCNLILKFRTILLVFFLLFYQCVSALEPDFVMPLDNVTIAQGRDATFTCVVNNLGGYRVSSDPNATPARVAWIRADTKSILAIHNLVITHNDRMTVTHNDYNTWTLVIRGVKMEDRGEYMCQVNTDPVKMQTAFLEVVIPPDIMYEDTSGDMMVPEGGSAKLLCRAQGYPQPKILWRREDGQEIISRNATSGKTKLLTVEGETLWLPKVTRGEMGAYLCIASNGVPPSVSKRMKLQVHFHPLIQVPNQLVGAPLGTDVTLICNVEASPKSINYWQKENGEMIITNDRFYMTEIESSLYASQMTLLVRRLHRGDFGGFKCISKNSIGDAEGTIRVYEMESTKKHKSNQKSIENDVDADDKNSNANELSPPQLPDDDNYKRKINIISRPQYSYKSKNRTSSNNNFPFSTASRSQYLTPSAVRFATTTATLVLLIQFITQSLL